MVDDFVRGAVSGFTAVNSPSAEPGSRRGGPEKERVREEFMQKARATKGSNVTNPFGSRPCALIQG
jgi:hypothetical protein